MQGPTVILLEVGNGVEAAGPGRTEGSANGGAEYGKGVEEEAGQYEPEREGGPVSVEDDEKELFTSSKKHLPPHTVLGFLGCFPVPPVLLFNVPPVLMSPCGVPLVRVCSCSRVAPGLHAAYNPHRTVAAFALVFPNYSTFLACPGLYLEDLYVREQYRGCGFGTYLLRYLARTAHKRVRQHGLPVVPCLKIRTSISVCTATWL